jgi:hypothetical protein
MFLFWHFSEHQADTCWKCSTVNKDEDAKKIHQVAVHLCKSLQDIDCLGPYNPERPVYCMDNEKSIYLPEKSTQEDWHVPKGQVSNFTFTPMSAKWEKATYCVTWGEQDSHKNAEDHASAIFYFIREILKVAKNNNETIRELILWADNCTYQNKNWILFYTLQRCLYHSSKPFESINAIEIRYLVRGHTHMLCDQVHASIRMNLKNERGPGVYTHPELLTLMENSQQPHHSGAKRIIARQLFYDNFYKFEKPAVDITKHPNYPRIGKFVAVRFDKSEPFLRGVLQFKVSILVIYILEDVIKFIFIFLRSSTTSRSSRRSSCSRR